MPSDISEQHFKWLSCPINKWMTMKQLHHAFHRVRNLEWLKISIFPGACQNKWPQNFYENLSNSKTLSKFNFQSQILSLVCVIYFILNRINLEMSVVFSQEESVIIMCALMDDKRTNVGCLSILLPGRNVASACLFVRQALGISPPKANSQTCELWVFECVYLAI